MKVKSKTAEIAPEAFKIKSEPNGIAVKGREIIPARQTLVSEKDIATLNNYAEKKLQETTELSEVMSTVPSIVQRGGIYLISAAVGLTSILLYASKVPIWIEAPGSIVPETEKIFVRATAEGMVTAIKAKVGQNLPQNANLLEIESINPNSNNPYSSQNITMPQAGIVRELNPNNPGELISPQTIVATITPRKNKLTVEAIVGDRDLAAIKPGMTARVKVNAYDHRQFGTIPAQVTEVIPNLDRPGEFKVVLDLLPSKLTYGDQKVNLSPGLNVQVEITAGKKRLSEILFSKQ